MTDKIEIRDRELKGWVSNYSRITKRTESSIVREALKRFRDETDETAYLLSNPANAKHIADSLKDLREGHTVRFSSAQEIEKISRSH